MRQRPMARQLRQWRGLCDEMVHASAGNSSFHSLMTVQCGTVGQERRYWTSSHPPLPLANMADNDTSRRMVTRPKNASTCPIVIYEQFKFFFDLYFFLVVLSQSFPVFRTGAHFHSLCSIVALSRSDILIPPFLHPQ
ncbi:hypothetical protein F5888DRAFT_1774819 [Russula emetica]|nr:hypothetical protein F5888DRAFT_1774819 [Russula emetica]